MAYAGNIIGYSLILMKGAALPEYMDEEARIDRLIYWAYYAGAGVVLLVVIRALCDWLFLTRVKIHREITEDRNPNAGLIEGALAMAFGAAMVFCL